MAGPATDRGARTRALVLAAAEDDLATNGLDGLRGARIAEAAGVSEATVWHHFGSKAGVCRAVMERYYDRLTADIAEVVDAPDSPADRLEAFVTFWLHRLSTDWPLVGELARLGRSPQHPGLAEAFTASNRRVTRTFERLVEDLAAAGVVRADVSPRMVRDVFFGAAEHVLIGHTSGQPRDLDASARDLLDLLFTGIAGPAGPGDPGDGTPLASIEAKLDALLAATTTAG